MRKVICWVFTLLLLGGCTSVPQGVTPVSGFDAKRYLGQWYEIARFDHSFERGLSQVTANYSMRDDGGIKVINRGYNAETNQWEEAEGKAYFVEDDSTGHLKVSFFGPFYASYVIAELDQEGYTYSLVTGPDKSYLWILARTPHPSEQTIEMLVQKARSLGYDTEQFIWVDHSNT
ncbi:lipocalin family protein [Alteromonas gilva]|uniref:Outer membrane lipoprotein Blc n=1 Tax=Alteromonas gilva TaxID=2987522 RepID=A0ABT5L0D5_9ALTE|nr:lipocalin family protein [Alteromonas gilva]MDC8829899.1 lipocalin family protein [Alteromonas gilva]